MARFTKRPLMGSILMAQINGIATGEKQTEKAHALGGFGFQFRTRPWPCFVATIKKRKTSSTWIFH